MVKLAVITLALLTFLTAISVVGAQTATPTMTPTLTPTTTTTVPSKAPNTGFGQ